MYGPDYFFIALRRTTGTKSGFFAPLRIAQNDSNADNVILSAAKDLLFLTKRG